MALTDKLTNIANAIRAKNGTTSKLSLDEMVTAINNLTGGLDDNLIIFNQVNDSVANYITAARNSYTDTDYKTNTVVTNYASKDQNHDDPNGYDIMAKTAGTIYFLDETDNKKSFSDTIAAAGTYKISNLIPEHEYRWYIVPTSGATEQNGRIKSTGAIRQINATGVDNCRDLGGFSCDGGSIKYGKLLRGIFPDKTTTNGKAFIKTLVNQCGIRYEINIENGSTDTQHKNLGEDIGYGYFPLTTPNSYEELYNINGADFESFVGSLKRAMENAILGVPTYIHCSRGIDRTGAVCFYLQGILGVSPIDLDINYELTAMTGSLWSSDLTSINRKKGAWVGLRDFFKNYKNTSNIRDGLLIWSQAAGIDIDLINDYRTAMSTGDPELLEYPADVPNAIVYSLHGIETPSVVSISDGESLNITLQPETNYTIRDSSVVVKMGGAILNNAYSNGSITIPSVSGAVSITADAYCNQLSLAVDTTGTSVYNGTGYINGKYLSSGGAFSRSNDASFFSTGAIPYTIPGSGTPEPIYIKGAKPTAVSHSRIWFAGVYGSTGNIDGYIFLSGTGTAGSVANNGNIFAAFNLETLDADKDYYKLTPVMNGSNAAICSTKDREKVSHIVMSMAGTGDNVIITVGEPIY